MGLIPTLTAIHAEKTIALANKEMLVAAGQMLMEECRRAGASLLPLDSEHNAIWQCVCNEPEHELVSGTDTREKLQQVMDQGVIIMKRS